MSTIKKVSAAFFTKRLSEQFAIVTIFFLVLKVFLRGRGIDDVNGNVLAPVAVLYGFFISFLIGNQKSRYNSLFDSNRGESSIIYSTYLFSRNLSKKDAVAIKELINNYLVIQLDYRFADYKKTDDDFDAIADYAIAIRATNDMERDMKSRIISLIPSWQEKRYHMQSMLEDRVSRSEWLTVGSLFAATIYSFLQIETPNFLTFVLGTLVCSAATMVMLVLYKLNNLKINSNNKIFEPIEKLFKEMDLLPYYPSPVLERKEAIPKEGEEIRVARYKKPYPDIADKTVEIEEYKEEDYS